MKNIFIAALSLLIFSCDSSEEKSGDSQETNMVGVPNTDGVIPDTTNAIDLSTHKKDTALVKDSVK